MRLLDRYRAQGYWEGMASGASVLTTYSGMDPKREPSHPNLVAAATQAYETNGVVFACTLVRMMMLAEASFKFRDLDDKHLFGNESLRILEHPWPGATAGELWARMEQCDSLEGNAFVAKIESDELLLLPPAEVVIVSEIRTARPVSATSTRSATTGTRHADLAPTRRPSRSSSPPTRLLTGRRSPIRWPASVACHG